MKKKLNKHVLKAVERVIRSTASDWPFPCSGILHQPKRPVDKKRK